MKKRILALALALCMILSLVPMTQAESVFTDVPESAFFYEPVMWAVENGITTGTSNDTFSPADLCVRAHIVTFLWKANGAPMAEKVVNPFMDVKEGDYWYNAAMWALENGITNGTSEYMFGSTAPCNRAQAVSFLYFAAGKPEYTIENPFTDVEEGTFYASLTNGLDALPEGYTVADPEAKYYSENNEVTIKIEKNN